MVNQAGWERIARVALGIVLMIVGFAVIGGTGGIIMGIVGVVPLATGLSGWCPLYSLFGFRTNGRARTAAH
ncbi:MAG: DUF2892 domain-containing protein [Acidimicrobiales bacterium]